MRVLLATTNKAKIKRYGLKLKEYGLDVLTLSDMGITYDVEESGKNPIENAIIKAKTYYKLSGIPTIALDDGLFLENVPDKIQPATNVRRIHGKRLNDEEMIEYYIHLVNQYGEDGKLNGYFLKGLAIVNRDDIFTFDHKVHCQFRNKRSSVINEGYPLASIQFEEALDKFKAELTKEEKDKIMMEREQAIFIFLVDTILNLEKKAKIR